MQGGKAEILNLIQQIREGRELPLSEEEAYQIGRLALL